MGRAIPIAVVKPGSRFSAVVVHAMVNCVVIGCSNRSKRKTDGENFRRIAFYVLPNIVRGQCKKTAKITARRRASGYVGFAVQT